MIEETETKNHIMLSVVSINGGSIYIDSRAPIDRNKCLCTDTWENNVHKVTENVKMGINLSLWCLAPLSTIFQIDTNSVYKVLYKSSSF